MPETEAIRCMQLPLQDLQLLVPNSAVAEIIGYDHAHEQTAPDDWFDGEIPWRGVTIPVVSVERLCNMHTGEPGARARIAVLYDPQGGEVVPYVGIILQDIPRAYLAEEERMSEPMLPVDCKYFASRADPLQQNLLLPDIDAIIDTVKDRLTN